MIIQSTNFNLPYANKTMSDGSNLFRRLHGVAQSLSSGENVIEFACPYAHAKITGLEVINCEALDNCNFTVHDSIEGTLTGQPKFQLNQFAFNVHMKNDYHEHVCKYDADLYQGMIIRITYQSLSAKIVAINFLIDEVKH